MKKKTNKPVAKVKGTRDEKTIRNEAINRDVKHGVSTRDLAVKYQISNKRVWDIANRVEKTAKPPVSPRLMAFKKAKKK